MEEAGSSLVEVGASFAQAYAPVLDFDGWRVAMLRHFAVVSPATFHRVERHNNTNEVFILTAGSADLILCEGNARPEAPRVIVMTRNVAYNVRKSVWHHVVLSPRPTSSSSSAAIPVPKQPTTQISPRPTSLRCALDSAWPKMREDLGETCRVGGHDAGPGTC